MWGRRRTSERIGEELPRAFPEWVVRLDPFLRAAETNGIFDAFRCRRAYHRRKFMGGLDRNIEQLPTLLILVLSLLTCGPMFFVGMRVYLLIYRVLVPLAVKVVGEDHRIVRLPDSIGELIQTAGIMPELCLELWMCGMSGTDFCTAIYLELRQRTATVARAVQSIAALVLVGFYAAIALSERPALLLSPVFFAYLAATAWFVRELGPFAVLSGMLTAADDLNSRRVRLIRSISGKRFWQFDADHRDGLRRVGKVMLGIVVLLLAAVLTVGAAGAIMPGATAPGDSVMERLSAQAPAFAAIFWLLVLATAMRHRRLHPEPWIARARDRLHRAGWAFEVVLVVFAGSGDDELHNWMAARRLAGL